jgi:hypothetical protein
VAPNSSFGKCWNNRFELQSRFTKQFNVLFFYNIFLVEVFEYDLWLQIQALGNVGISHLNFNQGLLNNLIGISHLNFNQCLLNNLMFFSFTISFLSCWTLHDLITPHSLSENKNKMGPVDSWVGLNSS